MRKTILKPFTADYSKTTDAMIDMESKTEQLTDLVQEMKPFLMEAAADLLQPRTEALAELFKKAALH